MPAEAALAAAPRAAGGGRLWQRLQQAQRALHVDACDRRLIQRVRGVMLGYGLEPYDHVGDADGLALVLPAWLPVAGDAGELPDLVDLLLLDPAPPHAWRWARGEGQWLGFPPVQPAPAAPPAVLRLHASPAAWAVGNSRAVLTWQRLYAERVAAAERGLDLHLRADSARFSLAQLGIEHPPLDSVGRMWLAAPAAAPWHAWVRDRLGRVVCDSDDHARALARLLTPALRRKLSIEVPA